MRWYHECKQVLVHPAKPRLYLYYNNWGLEGIRVSGRYKRHAWVERAGKWVVKLRHETKEPMIWEMVKNTKDAKYFVPLIAYGQTKDGTWLIQPHLNFDFSTCLTPAQKAKIYELCDKFKLTDVYPDRAPVNVAIYKGEPVIYDYEM